MHEAYDRNSPEETARLRLERTAFYLGAICIPCTLVWPIVAPCLLGSMAIIFAVLSRGGSLKWSRRSKAAAILGAAGILLNVLYLGIALRTVQTMLSDPEGRQHLSDLLYQQYGMTLEELLGQFPSLR